MFSTDFSHKAKIIIRTQVYEFIDYYFNQDSIKLKIRMLYFDNKPQEEIASL